MEIKVRGDKPGKQHRIAGFKQGSHFIVLTFRELKGEKFEVKTPTKGTIEHKSKNYFMDYRNWDKKIKYGKLMKQLKKTDNQLDKLNNWNLSFLIGDKEFL